MAESSIDPETIRGWIAAGEDRIAILVANAERLQREIAQLRTQLSLMYELLATNPGMTTSAPGAGKSIRERVVDQVVEVLREAQRPLRAQDIHNAFLRREFPLPGSGTPANIAAHLVDKEVFTRPGRGYFGLKEWEGT
jgi:hypothetical protein